MSARVAGLLAVFALGAAARAEVFDSAVVSGLSARNVGSAAMSGRISALAGRVEADGKVTLFVGAASGGVWRSVDGATTFKPVFDKQPVQSIGAVALDPTAPQVVWVGTGESWTRNSVSVGDGIYKSTDGGESWTHMGLSSSERISQIIARGNTVWACVPGKLWSDSAERGLYKSTDGGHTWALVLKGPNLSTGCGSISMDPTRPERLFASLWDFRRKGWTFRSGGEGPSAPSGSGLFVTEDGGKRWQRLDGTGGLPKGPWGRVAVTVAPSDAKVVYAVVESVRSALYRSSDGGKTWEERDRSNPMVWRPFYFSNLVVDPKNPERIFKPNLRLIASDDGGKSFTGVGGGTHGDHHDLWINPANTQHLFTADDGGLWMSHDGGNKWWKLDNLPVSQFYHVSVDDDDPYHVYGGLQDNSSWVGDSAYPGGITPSRWEALYTGDGFWIFPDPADRNFVYAEYQGGNLARVDRRTLSARAIQPKAGAHEKLRFNWNTPLHLSPNEKGTLYIGAQFLFRTRDQGQSWERISPDLTTNDPQKQRQEESGGITVDNSAAEMHTTIFAIAESPKNGKLIWVGTDDGLVQLTRDGGKRWQDVTGNIPGLPKASWVSSIAASRFDECTAYATFDRHTFGEMTPWLYKTADCGKSWQQLVGPQTPVRGYAHVVKEDSVSKGVLFLGTELGLWISVDGGRRWAEFKGGGFPSVAVRDLAVQARDNDLVIGTHGRGIWIIDDISPLRQLSDAVLKQEVALLSARPVQQRIRGSGGWVEGDARHVGPNPPGGAVITYYQRARHVFGRMKVEILDPSGKVVDTVPASKRKGINRVVWSMEIPPPRVPTGAQVVEHGGDGPRVLPGKYRVRITKGGQVVEGPLEIGFDRRSRLTLAERKAQLDAAMSAHALFGRMADAVDRLNGIQALAADRAEMTKPNPKLSKELWEIAERAEKLRQKFVATKEGGAITGEERLREHLDSVYGALLSYEGRPGDYLLARVKVIEQEVGEVLAEVSTLVEKDLPPLNKELKDLGVEEISLREADDEGGRIAAARKWKQAVDPDETGVALERD